MSHFIITGAVGGTPNRLEINGFVQNEKYFSLFIQALRAMQQDDQDNLQSYFSVGKVHGLPYRPWDGAVGEQPWDPNTTWGGYCTHGSVLFPTWHRPYLMLYEQVIQSHAQRIAATYTTCDKEAWIQAAVDLRHPYWDWAAKAVPPDEVIVLQQVTITAPNGSRVSVDNPWYHYTFHPLDPSFPAPYSLWPSTIRQPTTRDATATDNIERLKSVLEAGQDDLTSRTYNMLTRVTDWVAFSNHTVGDGGSTSNSLEAVHDTIHFYCGGGGTMSSPGLAGYDPIFHLHHANVDRMLQLWSALNPGVWVTPNDSVDGSFTIPVDTTIDQNTPLTPFWNGQTSFWASSGTIDTRQLGYTYPEFNGLDLGNPQAVRLAIGNIVNALYGASFFDTPPAESSIIAASIPVQRLAKSASSGKGEAPVGNQQQAPVAAPTTSLASAGSGAASHPHHTAGHGPHIVPSRHVVPPNRGLYEWTARIHFKQYELGCSLAVLLFLGKVPDDPEQWQVSPNYVGGHFAFVNGSASQCSNCRSQADVVVEGFVHLNKGILTHSGLNSLEPSVIEPYLKESLSWRVQKEDGDPATLTSLEVCVYLTPLSYPPGSMFPVPGERRRCNGITHGKEGGSRDPLV